MPSDLDSTCDDYIETVTDEHCRLRACNAVADRWYVLKGLEVMLQDQQVRRDVLERRHLHEIIGMNTWIFGEEYAVSVSDQSLNRALAAHKRFLHEELDDWGPVKRADGTTGRVDLMLSRRILRGALREHLVVELKRPTRCIDADCVRQIESYAFAVANDERFKGVETTWAFWIVSNDMDDAARRMSRQRDRPVGLLYDDHAMQLKVWVMTWAQVLDNCYARLQFFQDHLRLEDDDTTVRKVFGRKYREHLPAAFWAAGEVSHDGTSA